MFRLLADENFSGDILRGLLLRNPSLDIVRVQDVGLSGEDDPDVLSWAADNDRILLTHDITTMPDHAYDRIRLGQRMPGLFVVSDRLSAGTVIDEVLVMVECSEHEEWLQRVIRLPI